MSQEDILTSQHVLLDIDCQNQADAFVMIADLAAKNGLLKPGNNAKTALLASLQEREHEATTAFGGGVAIPHARNDNIIKTGIIIIRFNQGVNWKALDNEPVQAIIALLVPTKNAHNEHLLLLSRVAQKLGQPTFQQLLFHSNDQEEIIASLLQQDTRSSVSKTNNNSTKKRIVALTACPVGVAHTYIAQDKLEAAAQTLGHNIKVETHGSIGVKGELTANDIANADVVIIASAAGAGNLQLERFVNKPLAQIEISKVIKDPTGSMTQALNSAQPWKPNNNDKTKDNNSSDDLFATNKNKKGLMQHLMAGVGYMVPFVVFGGIMMALSLGISQAIYGPGETAPYPSFLWFLDQAGKVGFQLMIPILAGFIANSIAGRAALAPAMISAFIANASVLKDATVDPETHKAVLHFVTLVFPIAGLETNTPAGFLGALLIGIATGYLVKWIVSWKVPKTLAPVMPVLFIPVVVTFIISFTFIYAIGAPIGWIMGQFAKGLGDLSGNQAAMGAIGLLLGAMIGFDMGGPVNKVAFLVASSTINLDTAKGGGPATALFMGAVGAAIPVCAIGMGLTTVIFRKHFNEGERNLGITAIVLGCVGISEGAIPFALRDPKRAIIANVLGSAVAGAVAGALLLTNGAAMGGPLVAIFGAVGALHFNKGLAIAFFFVAMIIGALVTCLIYGLLLQIATGKLQLRHKLSRIKTFAKKKKTPKVAKTVK